MRFDTDFLEERFHYFNHLIFNGKLSPIPFHINHGVSRAAYIRSLRIPTMRGAKYCKFQFHASDALDLPKSQLEDIILHEMIHYYILSHGIEDTSPHGHIFRKMMKSINESYKRHITISIRRDKTMNPQRGSDKKCCTAFLVTAEIENHGIGLTFCASTRVRNIHHALRTDHRLKNIQWYAYRGSSLYGLPRVRKPKLYNVTETLFSKIMENSTPLYPDTGWQQFLA